MVNLNLNINGAKLNEQPRGRGFAPFFVNMVLIGGGGSGGNSSDARFGGGGGGAGSFVSASWLIEPRTEWTVIIGEGGVSGSDGTATQLVKPSTSEVYFNAPGGGHGAQGSFGQWSGSIGGSGGGNSGLNPEVERTGIISGSHAPLASFAYNSTGKSGGLGADYRTGITRQFTNIGGGGGGVNGEGGNAPSAPSFAPGGTGFNPALTIVSGALAPSITAIANGGAGNYGAYIEFSTSGSNGTSAPANSGNGGQGARGGTDNPLYLGGSGGSGILVIRYDGAPKAQGGVITTAGGVTTHVFYSSSILTVDGA